MEAHYDEYGNLDNEIEIDANELLEKVHEQVDNHMLEKTIFNPYSEDIVSIIIDTLNIEPTIKETKGNQPLLD